MSRVHLTVLLLILLGTLVLQEGPPRTRAGTADLLVTVNTDKDIYIVGEPVRITVLVANQGQESTALHFSSTCQAAFSIEDTTRVWYDLRQQMVCGLMLTDVVLEPGDSASYGFTWNHVDDSGNQVPAPHHFLVRGMILSWEAVGPADTIIRIRKPLGPVAALTWETCVLCLAPGSSVFFNASWSAPRKAIMEYLWDFGDGNEPVKTTEPSISHVFFTTDRSLVSLTVTSLNGLTDTLSLPVVFLLIPRFTYTPFHPRVFQPVLFDGSDSISYRNGIDEFRWDFGDGTVATDKIVSHSCSRPGIYGITLTILSGTELSSTSETIFVRMSGDVNLDCTVNILDLVTVAGLFMKTSNQADYDPAADVNSDGIVNLLDIVSVATEFNSACEAPTM